MLQRRTLTSLVLAGSILLGAVTTDGVAQAQGRSFCGTVRSRPNRCLIVAAGFAERGDVDISSARPRPRVGQMIAGTGRSRGLSRCIPGNPRLGAVSWRRVTACPRTP
jgi:hypothetical protein